MKRILLMLIIAGSFFGARSQTITFERNYKGTWAYEAYSILQTPGGGYIFSGRNDSDKFMVGALTPGGKMKWQKSYGGDDVSIGRHVIATSDGNYVASGDYGITDNYEKSVAIVKFDTNGNIKFQRKYRGLYDMWGYSVAEAPDAYIVAAYCEPAVGYELRLYKFNKTTGDSLSCRTYSYPTYQVFYKIKKLSDNNFLLVGQRNDSICLFKINANRDSLWSKEMYVWYTAFNFIETPDNGFMLGTDGAIVKTNSSGVPQWIKEQTEWGFGWSYLMKYYEVVPTLDGNYVLAGLWDPDEPWEFIAKFTPVGDTIWTRKFYTKVSWQRARSVQATKDSGFITCGAQFDTSEANFKWQNMNFIKVDKNGDIYHVDTPKVCLVTIDPATEYNRIVWERSISKGINYYAVNIKDGLLWKTLKNIPYDSLSVYKDVTSQTQNYHYKYCITAVNYNEDSLPSPYIETMLLQASPGTSGNVANLSWNPYLDESGKFIPAYYYIYKGKSKTSFTKIDSISGDTKSPSYNDTKYDGTITYYQVGFNKPSPCAPAVLKAEAGPYSQSLSNIVEYKAGKLSGINEIPISVYPNPFTDIINVEYTLDNLEKTIIELYNNLGQKMAIFENPSAVAGLNTAIINSGNLASGVYSLKLIIGDKISIIKVSKQ